MAAETVALMVLPLSVGVEAVGTAFEFVTLGKANLALAAKSKMVVVVDVEGKCQQQWQVASTANESNDRKKEAAAESVVVTAVGAKENDKRQQMG